MPTERFPTPQELEELYNAGIDVNAIKGQKLVFNDDAGDSIGSTVGKTVKAHIGGYLGGGAGGIAGGLGTTALLGAVGAPVTGGASLLLPLVGAAIGGIGGSYVGQKGQQAVLPDDVNARLEEDYSKAAEEHPVTAAITDIVASGLAGGGKPSIANPARAARAIFTRTAGRDLLSAADRKAMQIGGTEALSPVGKEALEQGAKDTEALRSVATQSILNPAINTGINYASTGELPTGKDIATQALGGVFMSGNLFGGRSNHPKGEPTAKETPAVESIPASKLVDVGEDTVSPFNTKDAIDNKGIIAAFGEKFPKPDVANLDYVTRQKTLTDWRNMMRMTIEQKRQWLHDNWLKEQQATKPEPKAEPAAKESIKSSVTESQTEMLVDKVMPDGTIQKVPMSQSNLPRPVDALLQQGPPDIYKQQREDFDKAVNEANLDTLAEGESAIKDNSPGLPPNTAKIVNTETLLKSNIDRPENWKSMVAENLTQSERNQYDEIGQYLLASQRAARPGEPVITVKGLLLADASHPEYGDLAKHLLRSIDKSSLETPVTVNEREVGSSYNFLIDGVDKVRNDNITLGENGLSSPEIRLHEIVHSATAVKLPMEWHDFFGAEHKQQLDNYLQNGSDNNIKELIKLYQFTSKMLGTNDTLFGKEGTAGNARKTMELLGEENYGMGNLHEFIAEAFTNKDFQKYLAEIKYNGGEKVTVWQRLVSIVKRLIGAHDLSDTVLEKVLHHGSELAAKPHENIRGEGFNEKPMSVEKPGTDEDTLPGGWIGRKFRATIDRIAELNHPAAKEVAKAFRQTLDERQRIVGSQWHPIVETAKKYKLSRRDEEQLDLISQYENLHKKAAPSTMFRNQAQREVYKAVKQSLLTNFEYRKKYNEPVYRGDRPTPPKRDEFYQPTMTDPKIAESIRTGTNADEVNKIKNIFVKHQIESGVEAPRAEENFLNWKRAIEGSSSNLGLGNRAYFNASRKQQGIALPIELRRKGYLNNLEAYFNRQAVDNAYYRFVESNHDVLSALNESHDPWGTPVESDPTGGLAGNPAVQSQLQEFKGHSIKTGEYNERSISSLATTMFISSPTITTHKHLSNFATAMNYVDNPGQFGRMVSSMIKNLNEGIKHEKENGVVKISARSLSDVMNRNMSFADRLQALAGTVRKISTLNDVTEHVGAGLLQAGFERVIPEKIIRAENGDKTAQALLRRLDPEYEVGKSYDDKAIQNMASNMIGFIHGTGDGRTMPPWMQSDSEVSGFFKLAHWSISQTNRFFSDVLAPTKHGDYKPLLAALFGSAVGGYLIKEIREKLIGKKGQIPSLEEMASSSRGITVGPLAYNLMAAAQYAGFAGVLSQIAKYVPDAIYRNKPQGAVFPLDEVATDMGKMLYEIVESSINDPNFDWFETTKQFWKHVVTTNIQLGRMTFNQGVNAGLITGMQADKKLLSDKIGQLRRFNIVEGNPLNAQEGVGNEFMNLEQRRFKMTQNPMEAAKMIPKMISNIMTRYQDRPDVMMQKIHALKQNAYPTFPSIEHMPLQYMKYVGYLQRMEGEDSAQAALMDYIKHQVTNKAKASMVPM